jgi:hypothetical protein
MVAQNRVSGTAKLAPAATVVAAASQVRARSDAPPPLRARASDHTRRTPRAAVAGASQAHGTASSQPMTGS